MDINVVGTMAICKFVAPYMVRAGRGSIINVTSRSMRQGQKRRSAYAAAKAGITLFSQCLADELGPDGVRVNCVSAGPLRTMAAKSIPGFDALAASWGKRAPLAWDIHDPEPVARTVAFLLSDWSKGITAEIIHVDGGYHAIGADLRV